MAGLAHFGLGFALKRIGSEIPIIIMLVLSMWLDIVWMIAGRLGIPEEIGGYLSHSLVGAAGWAVVGWVTVFIIFRKTTAATVAAGAIMSHWILDATVWPMTAVIPGSTKMPLWFAPEPTIGLGLYRTLPGVIIGEAGILGAGIVLYVFWRRKLKSGSVVKNP